MARRCYLSGTTNLSSKRDDLNIIVNQYTEFDVYGMKFVQVAAKCSSCERFTFLHINIFASQGSDPLLSIAMCKIGMLYLTQGIQKHGTMRITKNDANLLGSNIKGGLFWCIHIHKWDNAPNVIVRVYKEYVFVDNSVKFLISMLYIKPISPFYYEEFLYFVIFSLLSNLLFYFNI